MITGSRRIGIVGTFDIENYGDLLFPLIARAELEERLGDVEIHPLSYHPKSPPDWPYAVDSVGRLPELAGELDGLLVGGGFLIRFDKDVAPGYGPPYAGIHHPTGNWLSPALIAQQHGVPVAFNAPGMHCNEIPAWSEPLLKQVLAGSGYVSVRDEASRDALAQFSAGDIDVVPDTGFGLGRLLDARSTAEVDDLRAAIGLDGPYIVVQAALSEQPFANWLGLHAERFRDLQVLVVPIGPVLGERSEILATGLAGAKTLPQWPHPLLLAGLVDQAEAVVGHSYHLAITGLCRGVPVFTPADLGVGKYAALAGFELIHPAPCDEVDPGWFEERLGKREPAEAVGRAGDMLAQHWDRIAEVVRGGHAATEPALNRLWQALPGWLEDGSPAAAPAAVADDPAVVAWLESECVALRARSEELERLLDDARDEIAERDAVVTEMRSSPTWKATEPLRRATTTLRRRRRPQVSGVLDLRPLRGGTIQTDPYRWAMIDSLFAPSVGRELAATYPHDLFKRIASKGGEKDYEYHARSLIGMGATSASHPARLSGAWRKLAADLLSPGYRNAMSLLIGQDLSNSLLEVNVFHYGPGSELGPHPDLPDKLVTHVLYFNDGWNAADGGCLSILRSPDATDVVAEIMPTVGNSAVIVRSDNSWHAVAPVVADSRLSRRSVTVTFYRPGSVSSMWPAGEPAPLHDYHGALDAA